MTGKWEEGQDAATLLKEDGKRGGPILQVIKTIIISEYRTYEDVSLQVLSVLLMCNVVELTLKQSLVCLCRGAVR